MRQHRLHAGPDFHWRMGLEDSPCYPTARLFRQQRLGDWRPVIARVRAALAALTLGVKSRSGLSQPLAAFRRLVRALSTSQRGAGAARPA